MGAVYVLESCHMAKPRPLEEVGKEFGRSRRQMYRLIALLKLTKYTYPGDRRTHLDADEVRRKLAKATPKPDPAQDD